MNDNAIAWGDDPRRTLKRFLGQYYRAKAKQQILRQRLADLRSELAHPSLPSPLGGRGSHGGEINPGAAALSFKIDEIESRIRRQADAEAAAVLDIMTMLDLLPRNTMERHILELRHIDCKSWDQIMMEIHLTNNPCHLYYNRGLDMLLSIPEAQEILRRFVSARENSIH